MAVRTRRKSGKRDKAEAAGEAEIKPIKGKKDRNESRRELYSNDPEYREKVKKKSRDAYRKTTALDKKPVDASLNNDPVCKEVTDPSGNLFNEEVFSIPEAAKALNKSLVTFKRWVEDGLIPPPLLHCVSRNYGHYSKAELQIIAKGIAEHNKELEYLHSTHIATIESIWQAVEGLRKAEGEKDG